MEKEKPPSSSSTGFGLKLTELCWCTLNYTTGMLRHPHIPVLMHTISLSNISISYLKKK